MGKKRTHSISSCGGGGGGGGGGGEGPSSPAASLPSFCKIILPAIILNKKLRIPENFAETYGNQLSSVVKLVIPDGRLWYVGLEKAAEMLWLSDHGWQQFVDHYSISCGDFLTFKYEGDSSFCVSIFDITSTEIHYPCRARGDLESDEEEVEDIEVLSDISSGSSLGNGLQFDQCGQRSLIKDEEVARNMDMKTCFKDFLMSTLLKAQEKHRALHAARVFASENPSFVVIMRTYNLNITLFVNVPPNFAAAYLRPKQVKLAKGRGRWPLCLRHKANKGATRNCGTTVELELSNGRRWPVCCIRRGTQGANLSCGWSRFARENQLEVGDICVFELIQIKGPVLRVSIFRKMITKCL